MLEMHIKLHVKLCYILEYPADIFRASSLIDERLPLWEQTRNKDSELKQENFSWIPKGNTTSVVQNWSRNPMIFSFDLVTFKTPNGTFSPVNATNSIDDRRPDYDYQTAWEKQKERERKRSEALNPEMRKERSREALISVILLIFIFLVVCPIVVILLHVTIPWYANQQHNAIMLKSPPTIAVTTEISGLSVTLNGNIYANAVNQQGQKATMDAQDTTIIWGDGYTSTTLATCATSCSHMYPKSGSYTITIIAVDTIGNKNTTDISVNVLSPTQSTSSPIQHTSSSAVQNTHSSSSPYAVIFSGSTQPAYGNMANYKRILVIGNNAYTMGDASDNYVASNNIPLVDGGNDQDTYVTQNFLHLSCCGDKSIAILETS